MVQGKEHSIKMLEVMFSWRGAATFIASAWLAMIFRSPWMVCFVGALFIALWAWLVNSSGVTIKSAFHDLLKRLVPVRSDGSTTVFTDYFEHFRVSLFFCIAIFTTILFIAIRIEIEAQKIDYQAGSPISAEFSSVDLMNSAGIPLWDPLLIFFTFFLLNTLTLLMRQLFIIEKSNGIRRLSIVTAFILFICGSFKSDALYMIPLHGAFYAMLGLAAVLAGRWVFSGFEKQELSKIKGKSDD